MDPGQECEVSATGSAGPGLHVDGPKTDSAAPAITVALTPGSFDPGH